MLSRKIKLLSTLAVIILTGTVHAAEFGEQWPGVLPLKAKSAFAASDLVYQGRTLTPDEAEVLAGRMDISTLEPVRGTDIYPGVKTTPETLPFDEKEPVRFIDRLPTISGRYLFSVDQTSAEGERQYSILVGITARNVLYIKTLLEKLGYRVPPARWLAKTRVEFPTSIDRDGFLRQIFDGTYADPARWTKTSGETTIELQDVIVLEASQARMYNLALGYLPTDRIADRRVLRALAVAYELLNVPESANAFRWDFATVAANNIALTFDNADQFYGNYEDARWIAAKIAKLARQDFAEIAAAGKTPAEVQALLTEKLIARRNGMVKTLSLKSAELKYDPRVSRTGLVNGQLTRTAWNGYGTIFATGPSQNTPFSNDNISAFIESRLTSNLLSNALGYFNDKIIPSVDLKGIVVEKQADAMVKQFLNYVKTGEVKKIPFSAFVIPYPSARIIAAREVVFGSYMGTDNQVQLADTVGVSASIGAYIGTLGVPAPWTVSANLQASVTRTYTHLRPLSSLSLALKYPYRNAAVPLFQEELARIIDAIQAPVKGKPLDPKQVERIRSVVTKLKEQLLINESIIVSDSMGPAMDVTVERDLAPALSAFARFSAQQLILRRVHITRVSEDEIQIYLDQGNAASMGLTFGLQSYIPILTVQFSGMEGTAKSRMYRIDLRPDLNANPDLGWGLKGLRQVLRTQSFETLNYAKKPVELNARFQRSSSGASLLFYSARKADTDVLLTATKTSSAGKAQSVTLMRSTLESMEGNDYQGLFLNTANAAALNLGKLENVHLQAGGNGRASDTVFGDSTVRTASYDALVDAKGDFRTAKDAFISMSSDWAGWEISKAGAQHILERIARSVGKKMFSPNILNNVRSLQLYRINFYVNIYQGGVDHFHKLTLEQIHKIVDPSNLGTRAHAFPNGTNPKNEMDNLIEEVDLRYARLHAARKRGEAFTHARELLKLAEIVEVTVGTNRLSKLFGGEKNVLIGASIRGFRDGAENAEEPLLGSTIGEIGGRHVAGPAENVRSILGSTASEFYLTWILGRM